VRRYALRNANHVPDREVPSFQQLGVSRHSIQWSSVRIPDTFRALPADPSWTASSSLAPRMAASVELSGHVAADLNIHLHWPRLHGSAGNLGGSIDQCV